MDRGFPEARERAAPPAGPLTDRLTSIEATGGYVTLGDAAALVLAFTGRPIRVEISVENQDAVVDLRNEFNQPADPITVRAGQTWTPDVDSRYVFARNLTAGLAARVQVIGRY